MTPNSEKVPAVVIGAGVVGCAVAYELSARGTPCVVLEKGPRIAEGVTSRNSGVIHAGIYYPPGSLKAESCIRGKHLLYEWCRDRGVPHRRTGKWIVGSQSEEATLLEIHQNAVDSGATGLRLASRDELQQSLPGVRAEVGIYSAETGIVDPYEYSRSMQLAAQANGCEFVMNAAVTAIEPLARGGYRILSSRGPVETDWVFNTAGLHADEIAALAGIHHYRIHPCRGDYFRVSLPHRYESLIYPVKKKNAPGLGVHLTIGLDGAFRLGPDTRYVTSKEDFSESQEQEKRRGAFFESAAKLFEGLRIEDLSYDSCGLRPKLRGPEDTAEKDFIVSEDLPGFVNFIGIESPGLTASRDLAQRGVRLLGG